MNKEYLELEHYLNNLNMQLENLKNKKDLTLDILNNYIEDLNFEDDNKNDIPYINRIEYKKNDAEIYIYVDYELEEDTDNFFDGENKIKIKKIEVENIPPERLKDKPPFIYYIFKYYNNLFLSFSSYPHTLLHAFILYLIYRQ